MLKRKSLPRGFRLSDIGAGRPPEHTPLRSNQSGLLILPRGQIWVERTNDVLWSVQYAPHSRRRGKRRVIIIALYGFPDVVKELTEKNLMATMQVLEVALVVRRERIQKLLEEYERGDWGDKMAFPDFPSLARSLGIDPNTGYRID